MQPLISPEEGFETDITRGRTWYRHAILGVLFLLSAVVVLYLLTDVRGKMSELRSSPQDNVQWTLTQLEVEFLTLEVLVERTDAQNRTMPTPPDLRPLRRAYDILYSRVKTIRDGSLYDPAVSGGQIEDEFQGVADAIFGLAPVIDQPDALLLADLPQVKAVLDGQHGQIRRILTVGNRGLAQAADAARREVAMLLVRLAASATVLLVTLITMTLLFRREALVSDTRLRENLATSARLETIFAASRDAILVINEAGLILTINAAARNMFGADDSGYVPARIYELLTHDDQDADPVSGKHLFDAAASGTNTGLRMTGHRQDGTWFPVELSLGTSLKPGTPICVLVVRDISHLVENEAILKTSRDKARAGERAKARFLGIVSHEMRTPLNGILGAVDLMEDEGQNAPEKALQEYLPVLRHSSRSLLALVEDVLDLTQIEGGPKLTPQTFDLDIMLHDLLGAQRPIAEAAGNTLTYLPETPIGMVKGDPGRLAQIIGNLLSNAIKFTQNGTVTLDVQRGQDDLVEFQIMDTGIGMREDEVARVFDDFYRTDGAIDRHIQGTGLGLGIARSLATAMGGTIGAESEQGEGSVFWVSVPLPPAEPTAAVQLPTDVRDTPAARILLVEDNATNRLIARRLLEAEGHRVTEATNGQACMDACRQTTFDLILMDISMPVMDGPTAAQKLRSGRGPNVKTRIVALTAHVAEGLDQSRIEGLMDAVLHKPLNRALLNDQIALALGHTPAPRTPETQSPLAMLPPETRARLVAAFITEVERDLPRLKDAANSTRAAQDDQLADGLHALAGAAASIGVADLHAPLITAEQAERSGDIGQTSTLVAQALKDWPALRAGLEKTLEPTPTDA